VLVCEGAAGDVFPAPAGDVRGPADGNGAKVTGGGVAVEATCRCNWAAGGAGLGAAVSIRLAAAPNSPAMTAAPDSDRQCRRHMGRFPRR
jgi:hypothetical protein